MGEIKTPRYWAERKHTFVRNGDCPACHAPVEFWRNPGGMEVLLDAKTYEAHFSTCTRAREYRNEMRFREGVL